MYKLENNVAWTDELKNAFKHGVTKAKIIYDKIEEISGKGENITLNNTNEVKFAKAPIPRGNIKQDSYSGKNKLNTLYQHNAGDIVESNGVTFTFNEDGSIKLQGTATSNAYVMLYGTLLEYNTTLFTLPSTFIVSGGVTYPISILGRVTSTGTYEELRQASGSTEYGNVFIQVVGGQTVNTTVFPQIEEGSTATSYEPYCGGIASPNPDYPQEIKTVTGNVEINIINGDNTESQVYPLTLGDIELCKIGDYEDYIYKENSKWYLHKEIKKFVYNNEGGVSSPATNYYNINSISGLDVLATLNINNSLSNKYKAIKVCQTDSVFRNETADLSFAVGFHPNGSSIRFKDTRGLSNNEFKASLIGTIFYYALATPTDTEITDTTLINELEDILNATSYEGQTNISGSSDGISPIFDVIVYATEETEINYDNGIKEITLEDSVYVPDLGFIGQAVAKKVTLTLLDNEQTTNLENKEFELYIGADYNNETYYINYGKFIVNEIPENDSTNGTIRVIAYDYMIKFNKIYEDQVVYPVTLKNYLINICQQAGVELGTQSFLNDSFYVADNQFEGKQLREILKHVAKSAFSWARVGQDNKLYLDFNITENIADTLTINDYKMDGYKKANEYYRTYK